MKVNIGRFPKGNKSRKLKVEIQEFDTWSLDHTLAAIIYPALLQLKDQKAGVPSSLTEVGGEEYSDQESFDFYKESNKEAMDEAVKKWDEILDKMIWSFEQILKDSYSNLYHHGTPEYDFVKMDVQYKNPITGKTEDTYRMVDRNPNDHWYDAEGHLLHEERIQEGLDLFGKYYRCLWS